ncbi:MAG: metallophosphoesterase [Abditibacteriota bacterium]|nr:metallophosphoesterase [Abditibacteriota bacterium]
MTKILIASALCLATCIPALAISPPAGKSETRYVVGNNAPSAPFSFVQMSDVHIGWMAATREVELSDPRATDNTYFKKAIDMVHRLGADFVFFSGDMVSFPTHQPVLDAWNDAIRDLKTPYCFAEGNHDTALTKDALARYRKDWGMDYYRFVYNNTLFITFNSNPTQPQRNEPGYERFQRIWLSNQLKQGRQGGYDHIFVLTHIPIVRRSPDEKYDRYNFPPELREPYMDMIEAAGAEYVLAGHYHVKSEFYHGGTCYAVCPSIRDPRFGERTGFRLFKVYPDRIETEMIYMDEADKIKPVKL